MLLQCEIQEWFLGLFTSILCRSIELTHPSRVNSRCSLMGLRPSWNANGSICSLCPDCTGWSPENHRVSITKIWSERFPLLLAFQGHVSCRSSVVYQDGYHRTHPVIKWLWQTSKQDFNREEQGFFLRVSDREMMLVLRIFIVADSLSLVPLVAYCGAFAPNVRTCLNPSIKRKLRNYVVFKRIHVDKSRRRATFALMFSIQ